MLPAVSLRELNPYAQNNIKRTTLKGSCEEFLQLANAEMNK